MPSMSVDNSLLVMAADAARHSTIIALAEKYGFDPQEAHRFLDPAPPKLVRQLAVAIAVPAEIPTDKKKPVRQFKRAKTGYLLFADEMRAEVKASLGSGLKRGQSVKPQDVVRDIAALWRGAEQEVRDQYNTVAKVKAQAQAQAISDADME